MAGKAAYRASLRSRFKNTQRSIMNAQAAATTSAFPASETHHQRLLRNVRNAAATAKSRAIETLDHRRARQSRDAAATARSRESETELQRATRKSRNAAATSAARNSEGPQTRANGQTATNMAAVHLSQTPHVRRIRLDGDIQRLAAPVLLPVPVALFGLSWLSVTTPALT